jgi:hypothetical protein
MKKLLILIFLLSLHVSGFSQELFPYAEPASNIPKNTLGLRFLFEGFKEIPSQRQRNWGAVRAMYGLTGKTTLMLTAAVSNHHQRKFPANLQNYFINHHQRNYKPNPYLLEGINIYLKQRVISIDDFQKHLRVALFGQACKGFTPHDESEPFLKGDNTGFGGGAIVTLLYKRFAASFTYAYTHPLLYKDKAQQITFQSGTANNYDLSFGYRLYPPKYNTYNDLNINLYVEFVNRDYEAAKMTVRDAPYDFSYFQYFDKNIYNSLMDGKYSEIRPSIQLIMNSNNRIDIGCAYPVYNRSYAHFYPLFFLNVQKYFYFSKKPKML